MSRATKQDTVVKYALLRGKLVPREEVMKEVETTKTTEKLVEVKDKSENAKTAAKPKAATKTVAKKITAKKTVKPESKEDDFAIDAGDLDADTKKV